MNIFNVMSKEKGNTTSAFVDNCNNGITNNALSLNRRCGCTPGPEYTIKHIEFDSPFGDATFDCDGSGCTYTFPVSAQWWAGFAINVYGDSDFVKASPIKICRPAKIKFDVGDCCDNMFICFKLEYKASPGTTDPSYITDSIKITKNKSHEVIIPSQGNKTFSNFILYIKRDTHGSSPCGDIYVTISYVEFTNVF